nr:FtsX-like permease family [uncultured bacterium]
MYFATLGFAACLLYSFVASTDHLRAMGLSPEQLGVLGSADDILQAFSVFTVLVFLFLVRYANRFLLRRRKREFALYELCGMGRGAVSVVLVAETALVGAGGDALTQRASGHVDAGSVVHVGMALQVATNMAQGLKIIFGEEPALGEHGIQGRGAVTLREDEPVTIRAARVARVDVHLLKIQIRDDIG